MQNEPRTAKIVAKAKTRALLQDLKQQLDELYGPGHHTHSDSDDSIKEPNYKSACNSDSDSDSDSVVSDGSAHNYQRKTRGLQSRNMRERSKAPKHSRRGIKRRRLNLDQEENPSTNSKLNKYSKPTTTASLAREQTVLREKHTGNDNSTEKDGVNIGSSFKNFHFKFKSGKENEHHQTVDNCSVERPFKDYIAESGSSNADASKSQAEVKLSVIEGSLFDSQVVKIKSPSVRNSRIADERSQLSSLMSATVSCAATPNSSLSKPTSFGKSDASPSSISGKSVEPCPVVCGESSEPPIDHNHSLESSFKDFLSKSDLPGSKITSTPVAPMHTNSDSGIHSSPVAATVRHAATPHSSLTKPASLEKTGISPSSISGKSVQPCSVVCGELSEPPINHSLESSFKDFLSNSDLPRSKITSTPVAPMQTNSDSGIHSSPASATVSHAATPHSSLTNPASLGKTDISPSSIHVKSGQPISVHSKEPANQKIKSDSAFPARLESSEIERLNENSDVLQSGSSPTASVPCSSSAILETSRVNNSSRNAASTTTASVFRIAADHALEGRLLSGDWVRGQLNKTQEGRGILMWYEDRGGLNSRKRCLLVNIIIKNEMNEDPSKGISTERFSAMAQAICKCFPREISSTYYFPRHRNKFNKVFRAKGKLYDKWINLRRSFREDNIIIGRRNLQSAEAPELSDTEDSDCTGAQMTWTKTRTEYPEAVPYFKATCRARIKEFLQKGPNSSIAEFLKKYPAYLTDNGHLLIEQEFDTIYPGKGDNFLDNWSRFSTKIIDFAKEKREYSTDFHRLLTSYKIDLTVKEENIRTINAIHLLALLLPSMTAFRNWKISRYESKNALLLCRPTSKEASIQLATRKLRLAEFDIPAPPTPVIVNGTDCNACIDDVVYPCGSPLAALDICCKIQFLLRTDIPPDCHLPMLFIKAYLYGIEPDMAEEYQGVSTFKNDLNL